MKIIEHRRHSIRSIETVHLNQEGVNLARSTGINMGNFERVITSGHERAFETAIAMGYAVDEQFTSLMTFGQGVMDEVENWSMNFSEIKMYYDKRGPLYHFCTGHEKFLLEQISKVSEESTVLIISHGGVIDYPLVHLLIDEDFGSIELPFSYCEGYKLFFQNEQIVKFEILRVK